MNIQLYDKSMKRIANIEDRYISCLWSEGYNTIENFSLEVAATEELKKKIRPDCFLLRQDRKTVGIIKTVQADDVKIVATGKQATRYMDDVAFVGEIPANDADIYEVLNVRYSGNSMFSFSADRAARVQYPYQISNKSFAELITLMSQGVDIGFKSLLISSGVDIRFYKPPENPNLVFSKSFGNTGDVSVTFSKENFKNVAFVLGEGEGENRTVIEVDQSNGGDRHEMIVDARDIQREDGETLTSYKKRLTARGVEKLLEKQETLKCAFQVLSSEFGSRFDLGDILTVNLTDYGIQLKSRVTRFTEKNQNNSTQITIDVGNITIRRI